MAAHSGAASFTDTIYAISASLPATYDAAGYGSTAITYTTIDRVQSFPEFGAQSNTNEFIPVKGAIEQIKGQRRYGNGPMVCADMPGDAGQVIVKAAEASSNHYSMKITYPDTEVHYLDVIVTSWLLSGSSGDGAVMTRSAGIAVQRDPVVVAAS